MSDEWENPIEDDGLTLGPEEALRREIEKSKALKVERLQLRSEVEDLRGRVRDLQEKIRQREEGEGSMALAEESALSSQSQVSPPTPSRQIRIPGGLVYFILIFNLAAIGALLYLQLQK